jgi:hypothetical protein
MAHIILSNAVALLLKLSQKSYPRVNMDFYFREIYVTAT